MIYYGEIYTLPKIKKVSNIIPGGGGGVQLSRGVQLFPERDPFANFLKPL